MHAMIAVVGLLLAAEPAVPKEPTKAEVKAPKQVSDFYELLVKGGKLHVLLQHQGGAWTYAAQGDDGEEQHGLGTPVVDQRNGFMHFGLEFPSWDTNVDLALFTASGGRNFIAVSESTRGERAEGSSFALYAFTGATFRDVTQEGLPGTLTVKDFMDEKFVAKPVPKVAPEDDEYPVEDAMMVVVHLPQKGTTVTVNLDLASLSPRTSNGDTQMKTAQKTLKAHQKLKVIELAWSTTDAKFTVSKKR